MHYSDYVKKPDGNLRALANIAKNSSNDFSLMIASRSAEALDAMESLCSSFEGVHITRNHICNGHTDPLHAVVELPDLLLFWIGEQWEYELGDLSKRAPTTRAPLIIIGSRDDSQAMRLAMKAGALDYYCAPINEQELHSAVAGHIDKHRRLVKQGGGVITAVMNAKGGAGGSFIGANIAHILQDMLRLNTALIGLDIQFGSLCDYFDLVPGYGLLDVLGHIEEADKVALEGYMVKHSSGLHLLDVKPADLLTADDINCEQLNLLLDLLGHSYEQTVIDLPRHIDMVTATAIERVDRMVVVLQQNTSHLHDAQRLLQVLTRDLGVDKKQIMIVVNRFDKNAALTLQDINKTLAVDVAMTIPNSFEQVSESINGGEPFYLAHKRSAVTKSMTKMSEDLSGHFCPKDNTILNRFLDRVKVF